MTEYIDRAVALEMLKEQETEYVAKSYTPFGDGFLSNEDFKIAGTVTAGMIQMIERIPTADVAPVVHGLWFGTADGYADGDLVYDMWECSECGCDADGADEKPTWNFCPNCGAKMDLEVDYG